MYKLFLTLRYLTRKKIVIFPILVVWLCVMMLIIVTSIMSGFVDRVRDANKSIYGDIIVSSADSTQGFAGYQKLSDELKANKDFGGKIEGITPTVESYALVYVPWAQQSVPALLVGVRPADRSKVTRFRESLFQQYQAPTEAVDDLSPYLPATGAQLFEHAKKGVDDASKDLEAANSDMDKYRHGEPAQPRWGWSAALAPAVVLMILLWLRARQKGWGSHGSPWRAVFFVLLFVVAIGALAGGLGALMPVLSLRAQILGLLVIITMMLMGMVVIWRAPYGWFYIGELVILGVALAVAGLGTAWPLIGPRPYDLAEDRFNQAESRMARAQRTRDYASNLPQNASFGDKAALAAAIVPASPTFNLPTAAKDMPGLPPDGCIVGAQIGFFRRDTRGNFVHLYPNIYQKVSITVFPPTRSGRINVNATNAVTQDFTIVDDSHTGVYDVDSLDVYADFETVQLMAGLRPDPKLGPEGDFEPRCQQLLIKLKPDAEGDMRLVRRQIDDYCQAFIDHYAADHHTESFIPSLHVQTWDEKQAKYIGAVQNEKNMMEFIMLLMSGVVLVVIFLIFYQIVRDKTRDIGIIKAVGGSEEGVSAIFLSYGVLIGLVGGGLGVISGCLFVTHTNEIHEWIFRTTGVIIWDRSVYLFDRIPDVVHLNDVVFYYCVAMIAGVLGAVIPAILAGLEDPVKAVRYE